MPYRRQFVSRYLDPIEVAAEFAALPAAFPTLCRLETLPFLSHGYHGERVDARGRHPMHILRITAPGGGPKPAVLLFRSPHAREWINALVVVEAARQFLENYRPTDTDPEVRAVVETLDKVEVLIVPEGNPDGARLSFFDAGRRLWRKNLRPPATAGGCPGVDCNRNYPQFFGEAGSSDDPCTEIYHGPGPLSEPEAANIAHLLERDRTILFAIDSHSSGQAVFRPGPGGGTFVPSLPVPPVDDATYRTLEGLMNARIATVQGVTYSTGTTSNHAGASDEYCYFRHGVFGFDMECGTEFQPDPADAVLAALEVTEAIKALAWCAAGHGGVDVAALLARRQAMPPAPVAAPPQPAHDAAGPAYAPRRPPAERERRLLVECDARTDDPAAEALSLLEAGYDLEDTPQGRAWTLVASAVDVEELAKAGYRPRVVKEYADPPQQ